MTIGKLRMPRLGETMESGKIVDFVVLEGASFARGDVIVELETDKTVAELPALGAGKLLKIHVKAGDDVPVGAVLADIEMDGEPWIVEDEPTTEVEVNTETPIQVSEPTQLFDEHGRNRATPLARRIAKNAGIDLSTITGTGRRGRIEAEDVRSAIALGSPVNIAGSHLSYPYDLIIPATGIKTNALFVHGFGADASHFAALTAMLRSKGVRSLIVDLEGHGRNAKAVLQSSELGSGLVKFAGEIFSEEPFHIVSHSLGIFAALNAANTPKAMSLTAISPAGIGEFVDGEFIETLGAPRSVGALTHQLRKLAANGDIPSERKIEEIFAELKSGRLEALSQNIAYQSRSLVDTRGVLAKRAESMEIRFILGMADNIIDPLPAFQVSPLIGIHALPRVGHIAYSEATNDVAEILTRAWELQIN